MERQEQLSDKVQFCDGKTAVMENAERREARIEKAKELLAQTTLKVYEISEKVGFTDYHYFLKIFKKITGFVPTDTRCDNFYHKN